MTELSERERKYPKEERPECSRCGHPSSEDALTLYDCGGYYLCGDCYEMAEKIAQENL